MIIIFINIYILLEGTPGDAFYVVATGVVMIHGPGWVRSLIAGIIYFLFTSIYIYTYIILSYTKTKG